MTIATLGLAVNSGQVSHATPELLKLTAAAGQAEAAATRLAGATNIEAAAQGKATAAAHMHTAALQANNAAMRMASMQRTNMIFQLNDIGVSLASGMNPAMVAVQQLPQMLQFGLAPALKSIGDIATSVATKFWPVAVAVGAVTATFAGLTYEINKTADVQVGFFDVALAGWQLLAESIGSALAPVWSWIVEKLQWVWDTSAPILKERGNMIVGVFVGSYDAFVAVWDNLPSAFDALMWEVNKSVNNGLVTMVQNAGDKFNTFAAMIDGALRKVGGSFPVRANLEGIRSHYILGDNPNSSGASSLDAASTAFGNAMGQDYLGSAFDALSARAQQIALARAEVDELGGAADKANEKVKKLANEGLELVKGALSGIGSGLWGAIRKGGDILGNIMEMLMSKVDNLIGKLLDSSIDSLLFGNSNKDAGPLGGGLLSGLIGMLPGFSNGGSGVVGGSGSYSPGAPDNTLFIAKAQKGEPFAFGNAARSGGGVVNVNLANSYTIGGTVSDKDVARMAEERDARSAQAIIEAVKAGLPGWQANIQVHGAA